MALFRLLAAAALLSALPATARAATWWYHWECAGKCAPGRLAISGWTGPFASYDQCDAARSGDPRGSEFVAPGNLGGLGFCERVEGDSPPGASDGTSVPAARLSRIGLALRAGSGFDVEDGAGQDGEASRLFGVDLDLHAGRPRLGIELSTGVHRTSVEHPSLGPERQEVTLWPIFVGLSSSPFSLYRGPDLEFRPRAGAAVGMVVPFACGDCDDTVLFPGTGFGAELKLGIDGYWRRLGLSADVVVPFVRLGETGPELSDDTVELTAPRALVRIGLIIRDDKPDWR